MKKREGKVREKKGLREEIRGREVGAGWKEVNLALQQIMNDHAGPVRSGTMLEAGLSYLRRLREKAQAIMTAQNPHELWRCLEVLNLLDLGEVVFITANERKETRGQHIRTDYPVTNPLQDRFLIVKKKDEKPVFEWREIKR